MTDLNPATTEIIAAANRLRSLVARATSCAPDPDAPHLADHDFDAISVALAETMAMCADFLEDAGFDMADACERAEEIVGDVAVRGVMAQG